MNMLEPIVALMLCT